MSGPYIKLAVPLTQTHIRGHRSWNINVEHKTRKVRISSDFHKIHSPKDNDIVWCCLLGYVNSFSDLQELMRNLLKLKLCKNKAGLKKSLSENNPFLCKNKSVYDKNFEDMLTLLNQQVTSFLDRVPPFSNNVNCMKIEAVAKILSINIVVLLSEHPLVVSQFAYFPQFEQKDYEKSIIIFDCNFDGRSRFSFAIDNAIGSIKQKEALKEILKRANQGKADFQLDGLVDEMYSSPETIQNLLISFIKNRREDIITVLFKSPYIVSKLHDAGFLTDPCLVDEHELSALYYALRLEEPNLLYFLYDHVVNLKSRYDEFLENTEYSVRAPNSVIIETLILIKDQLDFLRSMLQSQNLENASCLTDRIDEICRFNCFQKEMCKSIANFRLHLNYDENQPENLFEATRRKNIVLCILKNYEQFFRWNSLESEENFSNFVKHRVFIQQLDISCAILFFDNLFSLKECLSAPQNVYSSIETQFFFYMIFLKNIYTENCNLESTVMRLVLFQERLLLYEAVKNFRSTLESIEICDTNVVEKLLTNEIETLTNVPEIYNQFIMHRVKFYLNTAISCTLNKSIMYILVIERTVQVLGESMKNAGPEFNSIQNTMRYSLPSELGKNLKSIRDKLSHVRAEDVSNRLKAEKNKELFISIQKELLELGRILDPLFEAQEYAFKQFILDKSLEAVDRSMKGSMPENISEIEFPYSLAETDRKDKVKKDLSREWKICLKSVHEKLTLEKDFSNKNEITWTKESRCNFYFLLKNVLNSMKEKLEEIKGKPQQETKDKTVLMQFYESVTYFLKYLTTDKELSALCKQEILKLLNTLMDDTEFNDWLLKVETILKMYENADETNFLELKQQNNERESFNSTRKLKLYLAGRPFLSEKHKSKVKQRVSEKFKHVQHVKEFFKNDTRNFSFEDFHKEISKLDLPEKEEAELLDDFKTEPRNGLYFIEKMPDYYTELTTAMEEGEMDISKYNTLCQKLQLPENCQNILKTIIKGKKEKTTEDLLKILRDRILMLKAILIDDNPEIKELYERAKSNRAKSFLHEKLVELYHNSSEFQVSVEMLLFDCMNILTTMKELKKLWSKADNLFSGINIRNVLGHGNPLLESLGKLLDPNDLPSELIRQMLQSVSDYESIEAMVEILGKTKNEYESFAELMNSEEKTKLTPLVEKIKKSERWETYAKLIHRKSATRNVRNAKKE